MPSRNDITGDLQQTKPTTKKYMENFERIFGDKKVQKGSYKWCVDTKTWIDKAEWYKKNPQKPRERGPMIFVDNFEPYVSMVTDKVIRNRRERDYDLKSTNSRPYEGLDQEQKEADKYKAEKEEKLWKNVNETMSKTMHEIEHGYLTPEEPEPGKPTKAIRS